MVEGTKRVNAYLPLDLYDLAKDSQEGITDSIIKGLKILFGLETPSGSMAAQGPAELAGDEQLIQSLQQELKLAKEQIRTKTLQIENIKKAKDDQIISLEEKLNKLKFNEKKYKKISVLIEKNVSLSYRFRRGMYYIIYGK